ncbi:hypothetical protein DL762_006938 [Monosporascus cannonballus]|uniref:AAA+ ATPase domain-containing protein n=1 Tax=Monosporascus cannonballus TaxID=155416 RepID=A0ABY0H149_9PEZI|nr:hypothetical protein DL762_006938 [Monosporascus cannonballus]
MHTKWLRAFRTAPLYAPRPWRITTAATRRNFHASAALKTTVSPDSNTDNDNTKDESNTKPDKEDGVVEEPNTREDEDIFGEKTSTTNGENTAGTNGENQGRKRRNGASNGPFRPRTLRTRTPEELSPVQLPKDFDVTSVCRLEYAQQAHETVVRVFKELVGHPEWSHAISSLFERHHGAIRERLKYDSSMHKDIDSLIAAAYWHTANLIHGTGGAEAAARFLESHPAPCSTSLLRSPSIHRLAEDVSPRLKVDLNGAMETAWERNIRETAFAGLHPLFLEEVIASLKAEFALYPPKNVKVSDLQRPITVINATYYTGFSVARVLVRHVAAALNADVLHLRAQDIARMVSTYLGQDVIRAPSPISRLGYKAAENSGRSLPGNLDDVNDEDNIYVPYSQVLRNDMLRKQNKSRVMTMDEFLNGANRAKPDELWEELKINSVLDELVHAADSDAPEQRPLLVHIDDYNAINLDLEAGSSIIGKIRRVVDGLWVEGRKIALVGTCSSKDAPKAYLDGLREIALSERLINLYIDATLTSQAEQETLKELEEWDYLNENERNIMAVFTAMTEPNPESATMPRAGALGLGPPLSGPEVASDLPESWAQHVLPLTETFRMATTMIGLRELGISNGTPMREAAIKLKMIDETKERLSRGRKDGEDQPKMPRGLLSDLRKKDSEGSHEEQLLSGLVNAKDIRTTFDNVHAPKETIESVRMLTTLSLLRPEAFSYGVLATERIPGCLLYGPPGTGKTLLAKAVAKESGANMIEVSAATINNMYVGESEKTVRALFRLAKKKEPLVIFIDEADALLGARGQFRDRTGSREVINQFLREWDGMDKTKAFIMVATNRPFDLDEAVLRRLPRKLLIDLPREKDRAEILKIHLRDEELHESVDLDDLARRTPLYSGSDLKNVCVAAAMAAVKEELLANPDGASDVETEKPHRKRVLQPRHFDAALKEIGASVSEDMQTLTAIRRFDERYGDAAGRKKRRGMGFEVVPELRDTESARVRSLPAAEG